MRYDVGSKVRVITKEQLENLFNRNPDGSYTIAEDFNFIPEMEKYCGKTVTIAKVIKYDGFLYNGYEIEEDSGEHFWSNILFETVA